MEVERQIAVHQNVRLTAKITPVPKNTPLRYEWTLNEDSHFASLSSVRDVMVNRSRTGTCVAKVAVKNKYGVILGRGEGSFSVSISQEEINSGKQKAEDRKRAKQLVKKARDQWSKGRVEEAIATLEKAVQLDPGNTKAKETLETWKEKAKDFALAEKYKKDGALLEAAEELADAVVAYKKSLAIRPDKSLEAHVKALEKKIAEQKKPTEVADAGTRKGTGEKAAKQGKKPLSIDDVLEEDTNKKGEKKGKPLSIDDILSDSGASGKKSPSKKAVSGSGKKPLSVEDVLPGEHADTSPTSQGEKGASHSTRPPPPSIHGAKIIAAAGVSGNTRERIVLSLDPGKSKLIQVVVTEASERTARGKRDSARIGEVTFYAGGKKILPVQVVADSNYGHGYSPEQSIDGILKYQYMTKGAKGWASAPMRQGERTWLMYYFARPVNITRVVLVTAPTRPYRLYSFQVRKYGRPGEAASGSAEKTDTQQVEKRRNRLIQEGYQAEKAGRFEEAIRKYTEAQKIHRDAKVDAHIAELKAKIRSFDRLIKKGYAYEKKGLLSEAIATYKKALSFRYDAKVAEHIRDLQRKVATGSKPHTYVSFAGKWRYGFNKKKWNGTWTGTKIGAATGSQESTASSSRGNGGGISSSGNAGGTETLKQGVWLLSNIVGQVGKARKVSLGDFYKRTVSGREGRIVITNAVHNSGHVFFKTVFVWQRPPNRLVPGSRVSFPLLITKLVDTREYSVNHTLSLDTCDMECGSTGSGKIGSVDVYSVHSPKNPTVKKTFSWIVPKGRKGKKLTLRFCTGSGVSYDGSHGWKYYYRWVPAGTALPKEVTSTVGTTSKRGKSGSHVSKMKTLCSSSYKRNCKGDVFKGGHWAGSQGKHDWIQRDFGRVIPISKIYIGRASTDITTRGFRLVLKLKRPDGSWAVVDELRDTNINRSKLSNGRIGVSIPPYTKRISPPVRATAFRLEFYGHGWFDASDIRFYKRKSGGVRGKVNPVGVWCHNPGCTWTITRRSNGRYYAVEKGLGYAKGPAYFSPL